MARPLYGWKGKALWGEAAGPAALCAAEVVGGVKSFWDVVVMSGAGLIVLTTGLFLFHGWPALRMEGESAVWWVCRACGPGCRGGC